ncbi:salutaridine reductase-like protein [Tanacetum coccineum]
MYSLKAMVEGTSLVNIRDRWIWSLQSSEDFTVASISKLIDEFTLSELDNIPTRLNISRRGMDIDSILCPTCGKAVESTRHIFFTCQIARDILHLITSWWNIPYMKVSSYEEWIAVVSGGNKGIGLEICRQLADQVFVVLTARDQKLGEDAVAKLHESGLPDVVFHQLDVTDSTSIASLANFIDAQFGKLDILVNNAGVASTIVDEASFWSIDLPSEVIDDEKRKSKKVVRQSFEGARRCLETNYYGAKHVTQALLPLLLKSDSPRIVNISSKLGQLENVQDENARKILSDVDGLTEELVDKVVSEYLNDVKDQDLLEKKGWTSNVSGYIVSKAALNAYTRVLAKNYPSIYANAVSPGFVATDMTYFKGTFTVEEGARGPVRLALLPDGGPSGQYFWQMNDSTF